MNKTSLSILLVASFILALVDFSSRLTSDEIKLSALVSDGSQNKPQIKFLMKDELKKVDEALERFEKPKPKVQNNKPSKPQIQIMSLEEQSMQRGVKDNFFSGEKEYSLTAIFNENGNKFALLRERHLVSGVIKSIKIVTQEKLDNYTVQIIENNHIELADGDRVISLQLFLKSKS